MNWTAAHQTLAQYSAMLEAATAPIENMRKLEIVKQEMAWCAQHAQEMADGVEPTGLFGDTAQRWLANFEVWAKRNEIVLCEVGNFKQPYGKWTVEVQEDRLVLTSTNERYTVWIDALAHNALAGNGQWFGGHENCMVFIEPKNGNVRIGVIRHQEFGPAEKFEIYR